MDVHPLTPVGKTARSFRLNKMIREHYWWDLFTGDDRCAGWSAVFVWMDRDEIIDWANKIILLSTNLPHPFCRWAHAASHVLRHPNGMDGPHDEAEERAADEMADLFISYYPVQVTDADLTEIA